MNKTIAITYDVNTGLIHQHFGETPFFLTADREGNIQVVNNGGYDHADLVSYLEKLGIQVLICGGIGNHAVELLFDKGIKVLPGITGKGEDALKQYLKGELRGKLTAIHECDCH